jgi:hypothetical protein
MERLIVHRWTKFDHDRLYVQTAGGYKVGYLDRRTGVRVLDDEAWRAAFESAIAGYRDSPRTATAPAGGIGVTREPPWTDLALNQPGQGVRAKAKELQDEAPVATFVNRVLGVHTDERAWRLGDNGEVAVAKELKRLDSRWRTLHSIPIGSRDSDIDHVVIGPGGVFTVNSKNHPEANVWIGGDTVLINGHRQPYMRNSRYEAQRTSRFLTAKVGADVPVTGIVAFVGARGSFTIREQPKDGKVVAMGRIDIYRWLAHRPVVMNESQVSHLYEYARRSSTWIDHGRTNSPRTGA